MIDKDLESRLEKLGIGGKKSAAIEGLFYLKASDVERFVDLYEKLIALEAVVEQEEVKRILGYAHELDCALLSDPALGKAVLELRKFVLSVSHSIANIKATQDERE